MRAKRTAARPKAPTAWPRTPSAPLSSQHDSATAEDELAVIRRGTRYLARGYDRANARQVPLGTYDTQSEAHARVAEYYASAEVRLTQPEVTVNSLLDDWWDVQVGRWRRRTQENNRYVLAKVRNRFGNTIADELTTPAVANYFKELREGVPDPSEPGEFLVNPLSYSYVEKVRKWNAKAFGWAVREGTVQRNPFADACVPKEQQRLEIGEAEEVDPNRALTLDETRRLLLGVDPWYRPFWLFLLHSGFRIAEATGLRWGEVDFANREVRCAWQLDPLDRVLTAPKTDTSKAAVPMSQQLFRELAVLKATCRKKGDADLVFTTKRGSSINQSNFDSRDLKAARHATGIEDLHAHQARHTFASHMARIADVAVVAELTRQKIGTVAPELQATKTYLHAIDRDPHAAIERYARVLNGERVEDILREGM